MASTIAQLIMEQGRQSAESRTELAKIAANALTSNASAAAEAARQKGAIWGGAINQIGQSIAAIPGNIERAKTLDLQRQDIAAQVQERQATAKKQQDAEAEGKAVDAIMAQSMDPQGNLDAEGFTKKLIAGGHASALKVWAPFISSAADAKMKRDEANQKVIGEGLFAAYQEATPDAMKRAAKIMGANGAITPDDAAKFGQLADALAQSPPEGQDASARTLIAHLGSSNPAFVERLDRHVTSEATRAHLESQTAEQNASAAEKQAQVLKIQHDIANPPKNTAEQDDQRYRDIQARLDQKMPVPQQDLSWAKGYEKQKTLGVDKSASAAADRQASSQAAATAMEDKKETNRRQEVARADIQKNADTPYQTAKGSADELRRVVSLAQGGNKIAGAEQALATAATMVTSFGLKRINNAEIGVPASAGNVMDRFLGMVGKYKDGQPIDAALQKDMLQVADALETVATKKYTETHQGINKLYGTSIPQTFKTDAPTPAPAPAASSGLTYQDYLNSKKPKK